MRRATCVSCASEFPIGGMRLTENQRYCDSCANVKAASSMEGRGYALVDPTICTGCKADWGTTELSTVSKVFPYCDPCREKLYHYPFPKWLQGGLAFAFLLLVFALAHGAKYFRIGKDLYRGERQVQKKDYAGAVQSLAPVAEAAPECEKCVLLLAEAYLLSGQPDLAFAAAKKHQDGKFESGD